LIPDQLDDEDARLSGRLGVFGTTAVAFFLAEMGDKTQSATVAMAAHYPQPLWVGAGTTLGMLIADVPAVFVGDRFAKRIPMRMVHGIAAAMF
ncbi:TMEM165/GDT1 family protein, partial [Klebsiella quasipneumoniae]|uniref:TMEM165/GDT1 family protein n=1 Tax=Klebsiella quasipneumoniae TaxID=1463165 RepID=UPI00272F73EE